MIKLEKVTLKYRQKEVFSDLSLEIKKGDRVIIKGYSGLGKTSFFYLLLGFVEPIKGAVYLNDKVLDSKYIWEARKLFSYVDQDISLGEGKVREQFEFLYSLHANSYLKWDLNYIMELLDYFNLPEDILNKEIEELSGGQRQRVALINSLLLKRKVFLLDEPTSFLDQALKEKVVSFFFENAQTLIVASHDEAWRKYPVKVFDLELKEWVQ